MQFQEIKRWAKEKNYSVNKVKDESVNGASYYWSSNNDASISGVSLSVSKLAKDIFNSITNNKWVEHQQSYLTNLQLEVPSDGF